MKSSKKRPAFTFPYRFAIIDLGTNSVRFDFYSVEKDLSIRRIHREKQMIRLGEKLFRERHLNTRAIHRAMAAFKHIAHMAQLFQVNHIRAVATSALRSTPEGKLLVRRIHKATGIKIKIISGLEEAHLIAAAVLKNEKLPSVPFALLDIGGGSAEISICQGKKILCSASFELGASRLHQLFLRGSPPRPSEAYPFPIASLRAHIATKLKVLKKRFPTCRTVLGSSGSIQSMRKLIKKSGENIDPFSRKSVSHLVDILSELTQVEILSIPGMEYKRADIILAGAILLDETMEQLGWNRVFYTAFALRDGILLDEIHAIQKRFALPLPLRMKKI